VARLTVERKSRVDLSEQTPAPAVDDIDRFGQEALTRRRKDVEAQGLQVKVEAAEARRDELARSGHLYPQPAQDARMRAGMDALGDALKAAEKRQQE
jgi:hypothetical protein